MKKLLATTLIIFSLLACGDETVTMDENQSLNDLWVALLLDGQSFHLDISSFETTTSNNDELINLADIVDDAHLPVGRYSLWFDFESDLDGFRATSSPNCTDLYMDGHSLRYGYISTSSRNLVWNESEYDFPNCFSVRQTRTFLATEKYQTPSLNHVSLIMNNNQQDFDLDAQAIIDGTSLVNLQSLLQTNSAVDPSNCLFDFEASDGFIPGLIADQQRSWEDLADGYINATSRNLSWDLDLPGRWNVNDTIRIHCL